MGRANNVGRSLQIISKLQGWDPCKIEGSDYANCEYPEDRVTKGDTPYLTGTGTTSPQSSVPDPKPPGGDTRSPGSGGQNSGKHNPMVGK